MVAASVISSARGRSIFPRTRVEEKRGGRRGKEEAGGSSGGDAAVTMMTVSVMMMFWCCGMLRIGLGEGKGVFLLIFFGWCLKEVVWMRVMLEFE